MLYDLLVLMTFDEFNAYTLVNLSMTLEVGLFVFSILIWFCYFVRFFGGQLSRVRTAQFTLNHGVYCMMYQFEFRKCEVEYEKHNDIWVIHEFLYKYFKI